MIVLLLLHCRILTFAQEVRVIDNKGTLQDVTSNSVTTSTSAPTNAVEGDVWFDTSSNISKIYDGSIWKVIDSDRVTSSTTAPTAPVEGDIWFDTSNTNTLTKVFDGIAWVQVQHISDDQKIDAFEILNDSLQLSVENDLEANKSIALTDIAREPWFGTDNNAAATLNTEDMYVMSSKIGIGTDSPSEKLSITGGNIRLNTANSKVEGATGLTVQQTGDIHGTSAIHVRNRVWENGLVIEQLGQHDLISTVFKSKTATRHIILESRTPSTYIGQHELQFGVGGNPMLVLHNDKSSLRRGDFGIGTTTPAKKLHVQGNARITDVPDGSTTDNILVRNTAGDILKLPLDSVTSQNWSIDGNANTTPATNFLGTTDAQDLVFKTNSEERIRIKNTTDQSNVVLFDNTGSFNFFGNTSSAVLGIDGTHHSRMRITSGSSDTRDDSQGASIDLHANSSNDVSGQLHLVAGSAASGLDPAISFYTNTNGFSQQNSVVITGNGDVGIGTTTAGKRLHVQGSARITDVPDGSTSDSLLVRNSLGDILKISRSTLVSEPWQQQNSTNPAISNTDSIYQNAMVAVGDYSASKVAHNFRITANSSAGMGGVRVRQSGRIGDGGDFENTWNRGVAISSGDHHHFVMGYASAGLMRIGGVRTSSPFSWREILVLNGFNQNHGGYGSVGIATIPTQRLDVNGGARIRSLPSASTSDNIVLADVNGVLKKRSTASVAADNEPWFGIDDNAGATTNTENIYHMGKVGIGVNDPGIYDLDVQGTGGLRWKNGNHEIEFQTPAGHSGLIVNRNNLGDRSRFEMLNVNNATVTNRYFELSYNGENALFLRKGGNVGIGIAAPVSKFHVYENTALTNNTAGLTIEQDGTGDAITQYLLTGVQRWVTGVDNSDADKFKWASTADLNTNVQMTLTTAGNLGLGNTNPQFKTHVEDGSLFIGDITYSSNVIPSTNPGLATANGHRLVFDNSFNGTAGTGIAANKIVLHNSNWLAGFGVEAGSVTYHSGGHHTFYTNSNNTSYGTPRMIVRNNGRVGINTLNPTQTLSVNGNADKIGGGSWSTFSDERIKTDIRAYQKGLKEILQINPVIFRYNDKSGYNNTESDFVGIIAQDIEKVLPTTVSMMDDSDGISGLSDKREFDSSELQWTTINAIKELNQKNEILEQENKVLKSKLDDLLLRIEQLERK